MQGYSCTSEFFIALNYTEFCQVTGKQSLIFSKIFFKSKIHDFPAKLERNLVHLRSPEGAAQLHMAVHPPREYLGHLFYKHSYIYLCILVV